MTDSEIIKALECCAKESTCSYLKCPLWASTSCREECTTQLARATLDLIQRQQERFDRIVEQLKEKIEENPYCSLADYRAGLFEAIEIVKGGAE